MSNVIDLDSRRPNPHSSGQAKCLACNFSWVAVAPVGTHQHECPRCHTMRGVWIHPHALSSAYGTYTCFSCSGRAFEIARHREGGYWIMCMTCGQLHGLDDVFPPADNRPVA